MFAAGNPADYVIDSTNQCIITATHFLVYADESEDPETGELRDYARVVLFDREGKFFKTTSAYAPRRIKAAVELFSAAEWEAGITFAIVARLSRQKRVYHDIRVVVDERAGIVGD